MIPTPQNNTGRKDTNTQTASVSYCPQPPLALMMKTLRGGPLGVLTTQLARLFLVGMDLLWVKSVRRLGRQSLFIFLEHFGGKK